MIIYQQPLTMIHLFVRQEYGRVKRLKLFVSVILRACNLHRLPNPNQVPKEQQYSNLKGVSVNQTQTGFCILSCNSFFYSFDFTKWYSLACLLPITGFHGVRTHELIDTQYSKSELPQSLLEERMPFFRYSSVVGNPACKG